MILPVEFLWSQLNGPQVRAISSAITDYWKSIFDTKLDYFNTISVDTANDQHLTLMGLLSGLIRPTITEADRDYFLFTEQAEHGSVHGFSDVDNLAVGGRLTKVGVGQGTVNVSLDEEYYRTLLKAWIGDNGEIGSLALLDEICYLLTKLDLGQEADPFYQFKFMQGSLEDIPVDRTFGDVFINVGNLPDWHNPLHIYAVLNGISKTVYAPQPRLFISIGTTGRVSNPHATPQGDVYEEPVTVSMVVATDTAKIYYTLDGTDPTAESIEYTAPITISQTTTLKMIGIAPDFGNSEIITEKYTFPE